MVSPKKIAMTIIWVLISWFLSAIMVIVMALSSGDTMKDLMCGNESCFEAPIED